MDILNKHFYNPLTTFEFNIWEKFVNQPPSHMSPCGPFHSWCERSISGRHLCVVDVSRTQCHNLYDNNIPMFFPTFKNFTQVATVAACVFNRPGVAGAVL